MYQDKPLQSGSLLEGRGFGKEKKVKGGVQNEQHPKVMEPGGLFVFERHRKIVQV